MVRANSICLSDRLWCGLSASSFARISRLFRGVRSSWLMFARNSDLYCDDCASCSAFSSRPSRAISISRFWISMLRFCSPSSVALSSSSAFVRCSSTDCTCSSWARRCDCASSSSVRTFAMIVLRTTPMVSTSCSRNRACTSSKGWNDASSMTPSSCSSKSTGSTSSSAGGALPSALCTLKYPLGTFDTRSVRLSAAHCPTRLSPNRNVVCASSLPP